MPDSRDETEDNSRPEEEREDDARSRALVPVGRRWAWRDPGPRLLAALCYFAWLGWVTALAPLLLLSSQSVQRARRIPTHLFAATGWSTVIVAIRLSFWLATTFTDISSWPHAEAVGNALRMVDLVVVLSFALLLSCWYAIEALMGRNASLPWLWTWARERADSYLGRD